MAHTWSRLGDMANDGVYHMYYRGERIKEAYYRGEKIWGEPFATARYGFVTQVTSPQYINQAYISNPYNLQSNYRVGYELYANTYFDFSGIYSDRRPEPI